MLAFKAPHPHFVLTNARVVAIAMVADIQRKDNHIVEHMQGFKVLSISRNPEECWINPLFLWHFQPSFDGQSIQTFQANFKEVRFCTGFSFQLPDLGGHIKFGNLLQILLPEGNKILRFPQGRFDIFRVHHHICDQLFAYIFP